MNIDSALLERWAPRGPFRWIALALSIVLVAGSGYALASDRFADDELPDGVALRIDGREITEDELGARIATLQALYGITPPEAEDPASDAFRRDTAKSFVIGEVIEQETDRREIVVPLKKARAELNKIVDERLAGDTAAFARFLGEVGITEDDVLDEITRTMATSQLYAEVIADVPDATLEEAREQYDARREEMRSPERRALSNIVVESQEDAEAVLAELVDGARFAEVASTSSLDTSTKDDGGRLGKVTASDLDPTYAQAAFAAEKGKPFGPVQSEFGWNVGVVTEITPGERLSFAEVKATLLTALTTQAQNDVWQEFLADLLEGADVVYADDYRPADPDAVTSDVNPASEED